MFPYPAAHPLHPKRTHKNRYIVRVTALNHAQTTNNTGMPKDNIWQSTLYGAVTDNAIYSEATAYGILIRGRRMDYTNNPIIMAIVYPTTNGEVELPNVGDFVIVEESPDTYLPRVLGTVNSLGNLSDPSLPNSQKGSADTWDNAVKYYARPLAPQLELPGNRGTVYNYNPIYATYHSQYSDSDATDPDFGKWYDRFTLFPSSDTYKNKKSFVEYNETWIESGLASDKDDLRNVLWEMTDSWDNNYKPLDEYFYLSSGRFAYRPDPVYDTNSGYHQLVQSDYILNDNTGGISIFDAFNTDKYPMPLTLQSFANDKIKNTAYDEVINGILSEVRTAAGNIANSDLPYEPKEEKQIRLGRNKLIISDMSGDGKQIFMTFKTRRDQQISFILNEDNDLISQVRIRGAYGEAILLESQGTDISTPSFSRFVYKGIEGQLFEIYDDAVNSENYMYMLSSNATNSDSSYALGQASYFLLSNDKLPTGFARLTNNSALPTTGATAAMGVYNSNYTMSRKLYYDASANTVNSIEEVTSGSNGITDTKLYDVNSSTLTHTVDRAVGGNLFKDTTTVSDSVESYVKEGSNLTATYDGVAGSYTIVNATGAKIEIYDDTITVDASTINLGGASALVARVGDLVEVMGITGTITSATSNTSVKA